MIEQTAESLTTVPLLHRVLSHRRIDAPVTAGLNAVLEGRLSPEQWLEGLRSEGVRKTTRAA